MKFIVEVDKKLYEISELVSSVTFTDKMNDGCSKLDFTYLNDDLVIKNGSFIVFEYGKIKFKGFVFAVKRGKGKEIAVTAYDQLRYCKAKDAIVVLNDTISTLATRMCNYLNLKKATFPGIKYVLPTSIQDSKTWLDIMYKAISDTLTNTKEWYILRDEYGKVAIRNLEELKLNLILGDGSLVYDYASEKSIDDEFYNYIKFYIKGETERTSKVIVEGDKKSIAKYGLLQYFETLDKDVNESQAKAKMKALLSLYNRELETLSLSCLGDTSVRAGNSIIGRFKGLSIKDKRLIVKSATHSFLPHHTMELEVMVYDK